MRRCDRHCRDDRRPGGRHRRTREHRDDRPGSEHYAGRGFAGSRRESGPVVRRAGRERPDDIDCGPGRRRVDPGCRRNG
jgi:hypothetical protein